MNRQRLKNILIIFVLGYGLISGVRLGTPWLRGKMFAHEMETRARGLVMDGTAEGVKRKLLYEAKGYKIPVTEENLVVIKDLYAGKVLVEARYRVDVVLPFGWYTHVWDFHPRYEETIPSKLRGPNY